MTTLFPVASGTQLLTDTLTIASSTFLTYAAIVIGTGLVISLFVWAYHALRNYFGGRRSVKSVK